MMDEWMDGWMGWCIVYYRSNDIYESYMNSYHLHNMLTLTSLIM